MVKERYPSVVLIENKNYGFPKEITLVSESTGTFVCLLKLIRLLRNVIEEWVVFMNNNPNAGIVAPKLLNADGSLQLSCKHFPSLWKTFCKASGLHRIFGRIPVFSGEEMTNINDKILQTVDVVAGACMMVRRRAIEMVGLLDEKFFFYGEDVDWCRRFKNNEWEIFYNPSISITHLGGASSKNENDHFDVQIDVARLQYFHKYNSPFYCMLHLVITLLDQTIRLCIFSLLQVMTLGKVAAFAKRNRTFRKKFEWTFQQISQRLSFHSKMHNGVF